MQQALSASTEQARRVAQGRERERFAALVDEYGPSVIALLRKLCRNAHDADDLFQETAMRVWRSFARRPRLRNPRAWLMTIAYRAFLDHCARRVRHEHFVESADPRGATPETAAQRAEERCRVQAAISDLSEPIRQVVVLHYTGGLTLRQTAQAMGISPGTVKSRLNAALTKLRSALE
jgi:RNA polymerase sigma-70 factor (ECF subfamily)